MNLRSIQILMSVLFLLISCGCSTVDKRVYYKSESLTAGTSKDEHPVRHCDMGGPLFTVPQSPQTETMRRSFKFGKDDYQVSWTFMSIRQFEAYWRGPLWIPLVPVFLFKGKSSDSPNAVLSITLHKEWKTKYSADDKSTWAARKEGLDNTVVLPKIAQTHVRYFDENNKEIVKAGSSYEDFRLPPIPELLKFRSDYSFQLPEQLPSRLKVVFDIENERFEAVIVKNKNWMYNFYLTGCYF